MAITQVDLPGVFNALAQHRLARQQEQAGALQMRQLEREAQTYDRQQNALARLSMPGMDDDGRRSALAEAYPDVFAKREAERLYPTAPEYTLDGGFRLNKRTGEVANFNDTAGYTDIYGNPIGGAAPPAPPAQAPTIAPGGRMPVPMPGRPYSDAVTSVENNTGNPAARNQRSSAMGNGQFINGTWLDLMKRNRPDIAQGRSDEEILSLRADPKLSAEMIDVYGMENEDYLKSAGIANVGVVEKYAAHFFGPEGAAKVLKTEQQNPNALLSEVLSPETIRANPHLKGMTIAQARQSLSAKLGGGQAQPVSQAQPASQPRPAGVVPMVRNGKIVPGWGVDANRQPVPTGNNTTVNVDTKGATKEQEAIGTARGKQYEGVMTRATTAQDTINQVRLGRALADTDASGKELPSVLQDKVGSAVVAMGLDPESPMVKGLLGRVTDGQSFNGVMMQLVLNKQTQQVGPQTDKDAENIKATLASLGNTPQARDFLLRTAEAQSQRDIDKLAFYDAHMEANGGTTKGAEIAWNKHVNSFPLFGVNPASKKPVFYQEFQAAVQEANPDASQDEILGLWRSKYGRATK